MRAVAFRRAVVRPPRRPIVFGARLTPLRLAVVLRRAVDFRAVVLRRAVDFRAVVLRRVVVLFLVAAPLRAAVLRRAVVLFLVTAALRAAVLRRVVEEPAFRVVLFRVVAMGHPLSRVSVAGRESRQRLGLGVDDNL